jgi:hypothetical protein
MGKRHRTKRARIEERDSEPVRSVADNVVPLRPVVVEPVPGVHIWRSFDAADINPVLNDPSVLPSISIPGITSLDIAPLLSNPVNVLLMTEGGGIIFAQQEPGIYEVHTNFLPTHRGRHAIRASLAAYRWMFCRTDCMVLQTKVPAFNKGAELFCKIVGATREFDRKGVWPTADGLCDMSFWSLSYEDWVRQTKELLASGHAFHERLESERKRHGVETPQHSDEECHDRYVGACVEMVYAGQPAKAVVIYNRWAAFSGYGAISLIARAPLIIDIGEALLQVSDHDFKVIKFKEAVN